ncbi:histidinol-phosphate transaminase [Hydrogenothermus marinus]|uniref:Histidinol-phosphate aminotransferase n=1 Tax=Hydrogenothermus marinus TaxID=133270 RepID=A0A3M0BSW4_9AQUI|nr:histidinol-phosphate transaminase [Hydrogenothermus marinus]RMA97595.1 histidinol phosphate aminotransferase [Hydrogenothermus marinus]
MFLDRFKDFKAYKTETTPTKVKLSSNENPYELPGWLKEEIANEIKKLSFNRYPDPTYKQLKEIIANHYNIKPENIVLGNGSDELIEILIKSVGDIKNPVMYPVPTFPMYRVYSDVLNRPKAEFELDANFQLRKESVDKALEQKPDVAFFASPNNPTGNSFDKELIKYVAKNNVFTVVDEAYIDFSDKEDFLKEALSKENIIVIRTFSKIGLAGIRLGVLIANEEIASILDKVRSPFNITLPTEAVAKVVLTKGKEVIKEQIEKIKSERERVIKEILKLNNIKVYPSDANFFLIKVADADKIHKKLIEKGVLVRNMSYLPKLEGCLRVSIGTPEENNFFLEAIKSII